MIYDDIWQSLEASVLQQPTGYVVRRVKPGAVCNLFLAVAKPSNQHILQIRLPTISPDLAADLPSARGIDVMMIRSEIEQGGFMIQLALKETRFNNIFDALINDIVEVVSRAQSEKTAVTAFVSRLRHWQKFLKEADPDGLSQEAQQGLYGELWFLRERLIPIVGLYPALLAWSGPLGAHQDFLLQSCAIEVKTTGTKEPQQLIIQSERQLDDTGLTALFLMHLSVIVLEGVGETLVMIIKSLRELFEVDAVVLELYEDKLLEAGFIQLQASKYERTGYSVRHAALFRVTNTFPRVVGTDLKPGVGSVRYSIAVAECRHYMVSEEELKVQLTGPKHGK